MSTAQLRGLARFPNDAGASSVPVQAPTKVYQYSETTACADVPPGSAAADVMCQRAVSGCLRSAGPGPLMNIWRRLVVVATGRPVAGVPGQWNLIGTTCHSDIIGSARPVLTLALVQREFRFTPWSKPSVSMQPKGNVTLVTLPAYYQVRFPAAGYQPGEVNSATMLGYRVEIRPKVAGYIYGFGDGSGFGPTTSMGGVYPNGGITHGYTQPGAYTVSITARYGGEFRVNGGEWIDIGETVDVIGPVSTMTVREARAVLVAP